MQTHSFVPINLHKKLATRIVPQADHPLLVGAVVDCNFVIIIEKIHMNNTVAIICSKMQNLKQIFQQTFEENVN